MPFCWSFVTYYICFCSILSAEFMRASIHGAGDKDLLFLSKAKARDSIYMNGIDEEVSLISLIHFLLLTKNMWFFWYFSMIIFVDMKASI